MSEFARNPVVYGVAVVAIVVGLLLVLSAEGLGYGDTVLVSGGVVGLAGLGVLTAAVARLEDPTEGADGGGH